MKKRIPSNVTNYQELKSSNYYEVDKTLMIQEFLERGSAVTVVTRPKNFGKTMNLSMMAEFFDITKDSREIFEGTAIMNTQYAKEMNKYPTIFLSFADCKGDAVNLVRNVKQQITDLYEKNKITLNGLDVFDKPLYDLIIKGLQHREYDELICLNSALSTLMRQMKRYYHKDVMVFIDDYDTPIIEGHVNGYIDKIGGFFSALLHSALKDNNELQLAMVTGVQRVGRNKVFADLNNIIVFTVADKFYERYFGFTEEETKMLLEYYDLELNDDVKAMYGGYNMGGVEMYNPCSIISYVNHKELISYWRCNNTRIQAAVEQNDYYFQREVKKLIQNGYVNEYVILDVSYYEENEECNLWGLLVNTGYLTIEKDKNLRNKVYHVRIPNNETAIEFKKLVNAYLTI